MARYLTRVCTNAPRFITLSTTLIRLAPHFYSKFEIDAMDDFTSQLMQRKIGKWELQKRKNEALIDTNSKSDEKQIAAIRIHDLGADQLGLLFQDFLEIDDTESVVRLIKLCVCHNRSPPVNTLVNVLSMCSQNGDKDTIHQVQQLCKIHHPDMLTEHSDFRHFLAEAVWVKGDVSKALEMFEGVYRENAFLRRRIRLMLKYLITNLVANGSEAALGNMVGFSERIIRDFQDFLPLTCVWQACFLSEWFTDQCMALELLERNSGLCRSVINRIPYVVFISLKCHRTEVVYRLLEILLKYKMKQQYSSVLASLLDYQFRRGDLIQCSEIVKWAIDNDVALVKNQHLKLVNMLLNQKMNVPLAPTQKEDEKPKYSFKF